MNVRLSGRAVFLILWDIFATYIAFIFATFGTSQGDDIFATTDWIFLFGIVAVVNFGIFVILRMYNNLREYASTNEMLQIVYATVISVPVSAVVHYVAGNRLPIRVYLLAWFVLVVLTGGARFAFRYWRHGKQLISQRPNNVSRRRTLIVGAGETGSLTINRMAAGDYSMQGIPVACVDDDVSKHGLRIHNIKVVGSTDMIQDLVRTLAIEQIVVAIPSATPDQRRRIYDICLSTNCRLLTLPNVRNLRMEELGGVQLREVQLADLLSRDEVVLDTRLVSGYLAGRTVLITGGGGSIGSELARQVAAVGISKLIIFDIYENTAYDLQRELSDRYPEIPVVVEIGSIRDKKRLEKLFSTYQPEVVFHAAAHKHVPLMENNPREAVLNNVFGTLNVAEAAVGNAVQYFIHISTDKAVNPTSVMGATKRLGEMIIQRFAQISPTKFAAVRFGNVLGSNGSVLPIFQRQIAEAGPVTVTDPDITRYFMTIPEASRLVIQAGGMAKGGEIFILEMGEPVKIDDLVRNLIKLSGMTPDVDIEIKYTGLRPGEKLYEELLMDSETTLPTEVNGILVSTAVPESTEAVQAKLRALEACLNGDEQSIIDCLAEQVPTYRHNAANQQAKVNDTPGINNVNDTPDVASPTAPPISTPPISSPPTPPSRKLNQSNG
ncbi:MAG: polysaccharide biosynthesis protein [Coriobacteriales bacterium]|jgi:FlaA1/EpsC-like NDP-sugar epimerase|nr:polysaccharide biosynthesis protein [Coriobacteriales bacterium]